MLELKSQAVLSLQHQGQLYPLGMTFKDRFKTARKEAGKTQAQIAEIAGVTNQAVSGWERGEAMPEPDKIPILARALGKTTSWLLDDEPGHIDSADVAVELAVAVPQKMVKVKGYVGAGSEAHYYRIADEEFDEVPAPRGATDQTVAVEVRGTSLGPLLESWLVFYKDIQAPVGPDMLGHLCVVGLADDRILVKRLESNGRGGFNLISNTSEPPIKDAIIEWAAKVTDMRPR